MNPPLVSIIITTKNEEKNIEHCLKSIKAQSYPQDRIEIIVVDNASIDKTKAIALAYTDKVYDKGPERSAQRNYGMIDKSQGEYVMYVDADMILAPNLISACVQFCAGTDYLALHIKEIILGNSYWSRTRRFERSFYDGTVVDGARFFQRDAFVKVGGFDEKLFAIGSGEDWDIDKKMREIGRIGLLPTGYGDLLSRQWELLDFIKSKGVHHADNSAVIYHNETQFNIKYYLRKKSYYAKGFDGYIKKWGRDDPDIKKQFGFYYRYFGVFVENGKWKRLVMSPELTIGMYLLRVLVGITFVVRKI